MPRQKKPQVKRRKDGRYRFMYKGIPFYSYTSSDEAYELMQEYKRQEQAGLIRKATVFEYAKPWLKRTYPAVSNSTYSGLAIHLQHLINAIGSKQLSEVKPSDIKGVYSKYYTGFSNSYIIKAKQLYCALFDSAVADGLIRSNPAREKAARPHKGSTPKTRPLTPQERTWVETLCTEHRAYPAIMTMLYAGVRPQEMKAIKIERDIDFKKNVITIHQTAHKDGSNYAFTDEGKTDLANRQIPLFPPLRSVLEGKKGYLITSAAGKQITESSWRVVWNSYKAEMETAINGMNRRWYGRTKEHKKILAEGGTLPQWIEFNIVPYDLRHTFCAWCRDNNVELNTCRKWMGHKDLQMILKIYDSVSDDRSEKEREKLEKKLFQVQNEVQQQKPEP